MPWYCCVSINALKKSNYCGNSQASHLCETAVFASLDDPKKAFLGLTGLERKFITCILDVGEAPSKEVLKQALTASVRSGALEAKLQADSEGQECIEFLQSAINASEENMKLKIKDLGRLETAMTKEMASLKVAPRS